MESKQKKSNKKILKYIGIGIGSILLVGGVIYFTGKDTKDSSSQNVLDTSQITKLEVAQSATNEGMEKAIASMEVNQYPEINTLVNRYFEAITNSDIDTLNSIVETNTPFEKESLEKQKEFIERYENITCYTKEGLLENTYIVYVYYDIKFVNINTTAPSLIRLYICKNEDGAVYIYRGEMDGEVSSYLEEVGNLPEITDLIRSVNNKLAEARANDEELDALISMLENGELNSNTSQSNQSLEESKESEESNSEQQSMQESGSEEESSQETSSQEQTLEESTQSQESSTME